MQNRAAIAAVFALLLIFPGALSAQQEEPIARYSMSLDLGEDTGQEFGSLFEIRNADGNVVAGAGFPDVYNTRFRTGRHSIQFFIRPPGKKPSPTIERLPHPGLGTGVYLADYDGELFAWTGSMGNAVRKWDARNRKWLKQFPPGMKTLYGGDGTMRLGSGQLTFSDSQAWFDNKQILKRPAAGRYYCFYYAHSHLCFYYVRETDGKYTTQILACPWKPGDAEIDASSAVAMTVKFPRETPFVWGQYKKQIATVSNMGGIYVFENGKWRTVLEGDDKTSYQVYSGLRYRDRLLLAQYPTGNVFEYRGEKAVRMKDWPPVPPGVSSNARECQTLGIYGGELMAGVWPWAELWRLNDDSQKWHLTGRAFTHPELTDKKTHPYEADADRLGLVTNHWGQRITSMVPLEDALYFSTSSKGTYEWKSTYRFLNDVQRREYGAVLKLKIPGNLAARMTWTGKPTRFDFIINREELQIQQDGKVIGRSAIPLALAKTVSGGRVTWRNGIYGELRGGVTLAETAVP